MRPVSLDVLRQSYWYSFNDEPVATVSAYPYPKLSDPALLLPDESPDSLWHLFAGTIFGIEHFTSTSGLEWKRESLVALSGRSPSIYKEGSVYYLVYETVRRRKTLRAMPSTIMLSSSTDLAMWSDPVSILDASSVPYASFRDGRDRLSCPQIVAFNGRYRLYAGGGIADFAKGERGSAAYLLSFEARDIAGPYEAVGSPVVLSAEPDSEYASIAVGSIRIIPCSDGFAAVECSRFYDVGSNRIRSAMILLESEDGRVWRNSGVMQISAESGWASEAITACDIKYKENEETWYCYYSAIGRKEGSLPFSRESLGLLLGRRK